MIVTPAALQQAATRGSLANHRWCSAPTLTEEWAPLAVSLAEAKELEFLSKLRWHIVQLSRSPQLRGLMFCVLFRPVGDNTATCTQKQHGAARIEDSTVGGHTDSFARV